MNLQGIWYLKRLAPLKKEQFDTVILGCTHYPLLQKHIEEAVGQNVKVLSSAEETAQDVMEYLDYHQMHHPSKNEKTTYFLHNWIRTNF